MDWGYRECEGLDLSLEHTKPTRRARKGMFMPKLAGAQTNKTYRAEFPKSVISGPSGSLTPLFT